MFQRTVDVIEGLTKDYWRLSNIRTGRVISQEKVTVEKILHQINNLEWSLGPARPLLRSVKILGDAVIEGKSRKPKKTSATVTILKATGA